MLSFLSYETQRFGMLWQKEKLTLIFVLNGMNGTI